jgi:hypothetical protein
MKKAESVVVWGQGRRGRGKKKTTILDYIFVVV